MKTFLFWFKNARYAALPQSLLPALVAVAFASQSQQFSFLLAFFAILGVAFAHLGSNLLDDYFDAKKNDSSYKDRLVSKGIRARIAKCSYLSDGSATLKQLFIAATLFSLSAILLGVVISVFRFEQIKLILLIVGITAIIGFFYSAWPFRFSYRGLGEISLALLFGPLLMQGVYIAATGSFDLLVFIISFPIGILVSNVLFTHAILDFEPDKLIDKKTLAVVLNNKKWINFFSFLFIFSPFVIIIFAVIFKSIPTPFLLTLLVLPLAISLYLSILDFQKHPTKDVPRQWFHQPMEQWNEVSAAGIGWFMIRWYTARNIIIYFCLICALIAIFYPL
jgi:1,4-dihydroxy-2-naphthoate octaprenyltransferase